MTLRSKLILWYTAFLAIILALFGLTLYGVTRWTLINSIDSALVETIDQVVRNSRATPYGEFGGPVGILVRLPELDVLRASGVVVQVWDPENDMRLVGASSNLRNYALPLDADALRVGATVQFDNNDAAPSLFTDVLIGDGGPWRVLTQPFDVWGKRIVIQSATSLATVNQALNGLLAVVLVGLACSMVGSVAIGWGLSNRALQPIKAITRAAERIASTDDLGTRLKWNGPMDELGRLTSVFNRMMDRIDHLFGVQRRFVADVSHELRTPLTAIRGHLELIHRYGMDAESLEAVEAEVERMSRLVSDLLLLAKADYGGLALTMEPLDLDTIISEVYREARVLSKDRDLRITIHDYEPVRINGDADRLKQVFLNLVSNAIKFTPDGGEIIINLRKTLTTAVVEVQDTGIGIAPEDLQHIFNRFYQAERSRARGRGAGQGEGVGLGLSIAQWIVEAHHGQIAVESEVGVGTTFSVIIPHIESPAQVTSSAITRPRLSLLRRGQPVSVHKLNP
jgi:two-component system OmpR family sensor kinase